MEDTFKLVGKNIQKIRKSKNLSQEELGEMLGLTRNYIGLLERGERNPSLKTLIQIAFVLQIPLKALFE
jgi:transcriptional regulator with XRE-family HTH domain